MVEPHIAKPRVSQRPSRSCFRGSNIVPRSSREADKEAECAKRKVRCSKTIPCTRCIDAGYGDACHREAVQLVGRQRKHKNEVGFIKGLIDSVTSSDGCSTQDIVDCLKRRIVTLETGIDSEGMPLGPSQEKDARDRTTSRDHDASNFHPQDHEVKLPALEEPDSSRSVVTIDDVAWGRQSKTLHAENQQDVSLPPFSSILPLASINSRELPNVHQARVLVTFHLDHLSWFHNALHGPTFMDECERYWQTGRSCHPLWLALYLAVLSVSAWSLPQNQVDAHFPNAKPRVLSATWYSAMLSILYSNNFIEKHSIYALQAIVVSNLVVYVLGHSDLQTVLIATAIRIAQCMGFDKHAKDPRDTPSEGSSWMKMVHQELVRRVWWQLIIQDYFEIAFANRCIVPPHSFTTPMPSNCDDHDLREKFASEPTISSYSIAIAKLACLMPGLTEGFSFCDSPSLEKRYQRVLEVDLQMRDLVSTLPAFLKRGEPHHDHWPSWVHWARSTLTCSAADKVIQIHKPFLVKSFKSPTYAYTRVTCLSAALTILKEYDRIKSSDVATIWVVPAFTFSGAIVVMLDLLHKVEVETADESRRDLVIAAVLGLEADVSNVMAARGAKLLRALLNREQKLRSPQQQASQAQLNADTGQRTALQQQFPGLIGSEVPPDEMESWFAGNSPYYHGAALDLSVMDDLSYSIT